MKQGTLGKILKYALIVIGAVILLYPSVSNFLQQRNSSKVISNYETTISKAEEAKLEQILNDAYQYNQLLAGMEGVTPMPEDTMITLDDYPDLLNMTGNGMMGYLTIPKLNLTSEIFHGTEGSILQSKIGHFEGTSLPTGGASTHAVLVGHRGLPTADLFTNLNKVEVGDIFYITIMHKTMYYQVDQIQTVLPNEVDALRIEKDKDYVTLVTCTPYGINSHRLLVRGVRSDDKMMEEEIQDQKHQLSFWEKLPAQYRHLAFGVGAILIVLLVVLLIRGRKKKQSENDMPKKDTTSN